MYRNISKILSSRLKRVLGNVISMCHSVFIPGREMMDNVLIINELLDFARRNKRDLLMVKVDFDTSYDCGLWGSFQGYQEYNEV